MDKKMEALLRGLFAVDEDGNIFLRVATETPTGDLKNAVNSHSNRSLTVLLKNAIVLDMEGNPAIRLVGVEMSQSVEAAEQDKRLKSAKEIGEIKAAEFAKHNTKKAAKE